MKPSPHFPPLPHVPATSRCGWRGPGARLPWAALAALALALTGCKKAEVVKPPPPPVVVMTVAPTNMPLEAEIIGQLDSPANVEIRARVEAFVEAMPFVEGTNVVKDQLLFKLDDRPYQERLAAATGALGEAEASRKKYDADVARLRPLAEKRAVPQQDLDNALAAAEVGQAAVTSAKARVQSAELDVSYCQVFAPTNGLIGAKLVSIGELVGKGQPTLLATMSTLNPIWAYCNVSEVGLLNVEEYTKRTGMRLSDAPVTLILANGAKHSETGHVVFVDRAVDVKTGTLRVRAEFPNPTELLRPGMFARLKLDFGFRTNSILVPEKAVWELQGRNFVWVVDGEGVASQRKIEVGQGTRGSTLVLDGLKGGERIIIEGLQKARQGQPVKAMTEAEAAAARAKAAQEAEAKKAELKAAETTKESGAKHGKE